MEKKHIKAITSDIGVCLTAPRNAFSFCDTATNKKAFLQMIKENKNKAEVALTSI